MKKAVFLDRDGTIIEDTGYIKSPDEVIYFENAFTALRLLQEEYLLFFFSNQSGIGKGLLKTEEVAKVNDAIVSRLKKASIEIKEVFVCPHTREDNCKCHKPSPFFLYKAAKKYNIDLSRSYLIGDHPGDVFCAENAGAKGIYVLTGHGSKHLDEFVTKPTIGTDILEAAKIILLSKKVNTYVKPD